MTKTALIREALAQGPATLETLAERAYYALNDTVPTPVREFILEAAGRVN